MREKYCSGWKFTIVSPQPNKLYICFDACRKGFLDVCRRVIGFDGCFLKEPLKGELLSAISRDANNQIYPIAWDVVEYENKDSWN